MIQLNKLTLKIIVSSAFIFGSCCVVAQSFLPSNNSVIKHLAQNAQSKPAWNNSAVPNTNTPAMANTTAPAGENSDLPGFTEIQPSGNNNNPSGMNSDLSINSMELLHQVARQLWVQILHLAQVPV